MNDISKIAKEIVIEGTKSVAIGAGVTLLIKAATKGIDGVKNVKLDELLGK